MWSRISSDYIPFINSHFISHTKTLCQVFPPSCSLHLTICCDWIVLLCCTSLLQWPRLSNCTSISAEMKKKNWNEQKAYFYTDTFSLGPEWNESIWGPHRKCNHALRKKKKKKRRRRKRQKKKEKESCQLQPAGRSQDEGREMELRTSPKK